MLSTSGVASEVIVQERHVVAPRPVCGSILSHLDLQAIHSLAQRLLYRKKDESTEQGDHCHKE